MYNQNNIGIINKNNNSITFLIEKLERPKENLIESTSTDALKKFAEKIEYHSIDSNIVHCGFHPFLLGMYKAYSEHRPFVISPDMIWLIICQGFSTHVKYCEKQGQSLFPHLKRKEKLEIVCDELLIGSFSNKWEEIPLQFTNKIAEYLGEDFINILRADFSTTSINERIASEITIMDSMKMYFEYILSYCICGIPEITIEGKSDDWLKIIDKLKALRKYQLGWWVDKLIPIVNEISDASKGIFKKEFWMDIFKIHTEESYGNPKIIDGWILNFFPFDKDGNQINFEEYRGIFIPDIIDMLPKEIVTVDFKFKIKNLAGEILKEYPMEFWAGFIGLSQNAESQALKPQIGWFVSHAEEKPRNESRHDYKSEAKAYYNAEIFPEEIYDIDENEIYDISIRFAGEIDFPNKLEQIKLSILQLYGKIPSPEKEWLEKNAKLCINSNSSLYLTINDIPLSELVPHLYQKE